MRKTSNRLLRRCNIEQLERRQVFSISLISDSLLPPPAHEVRDDAFVVKLNSADNVLAPLDNDYGYGYPIWLMNGMDLTLDANAARSVAPSKILEISQPAHGEVRIAADGRTVKYTPAAGYEGFDQFTYVATGFDTPNNVGTVFINVVQPLLGLEDWYRVAPGREMTLDVLENDRRNAAPYQYHPIDATDAPLRLRITHVSQPDSGGSARIAADGRSLVYSSSSSFSGVARFSYEFIDHEGYLGQASVVVRVAESDLPTDNTGPLWPEQIDQLRREQIVEANAHLFGAGSTYDVYPWYRPLLFSASEQAFSLRSEVMLNSFSLDARDNFSDTNNQISDVDEDDIVENDGRYLYLFSNSEDVNELVIIDTQHDVEPTVVSRTQFDGILIGQHLLGDTLAVITRKYLPDGKVSTKLTILNVADRSTPTVVRASALNSDYQQSRVIGDKLYLFTQRGVQVPQPELRAPVSEWSVRFYETGRQMLARLGNNLFDGTLPLTTNYDSFGAVVGQSTNSAAAAAIVQAEPWSTLQLIDAFDLDADAIGQFDSDIIATQYGATLFVSSTSAYLFENDWSSSFQTTKINLFLFDRVDGSVDWAASGTVPGGLLNSFSAGEFAGNLQIATSNWQNGNHVTILTQDGTSLKKIGSLDNLAPGESIYAARFLGERAFVVTFRTIDPLYVLDLSDPAHPRIASELKLPCYSQYLQVVDDTHLLGIGRNADEETGLYAELQVSLFDISQTSSPKVVSQYRYAGGRSTFSAFAENDVRSISDHHAISYFSESGILALPIYSLPYNEHRAEFEPILDNPEASMMSVLRIDREAGIQSLGSVNFPNRATRSVRIDDLLYSISTDRIVVTELLDPSGKIAEVFFGQGATDDVAQTNDGEKISINVLRNDGFKGQSNVGRVTTTTTTNKDVTVEVAEDGKTIFVTPPEGIAGVHTVKYSVAGPEGIRSEGTVRVETPWIWHNNAQPLDVDANGTVSALDVLNVVNMLNQHSANNIQDMESFLFSSLPAEGEQTRSIVRADVNGDESVTALDVLLIVNHINNRQLTNPQGEQASLKHDQPASLDLASFFLPWSDTNAAPRRRELRSFDWEVAVDYSVFDEIFSDESTF